MLYPHFKHCNAPFDSLHAYEKYYLCCPGWLPQEIGDLSENPLHVWNSPIAESIRNSIRNNKFNYCKGCPILDQLQPGRERQDYRKGPLYINLSHDRTCNLACPSCRVSHIFESDSNVEKLIRFQDNLLETFKHTVKGLTITGSGDAFGSRVHLHLLSSMKKEDYPNIEELILCSNGLLIERNWEKISGVHHRIKEMSVSIDAGTPKTYKINRGAKWLTLLRNLEFLKSKKQEHGFEIVFRYVVQSNNWREMKELVALGEKMDVDRIIFQKMVNLTFTLEDYEHRSIHKKSHPDHHLFVKELNELSKLDRVKLFHFADIMQGYKKQPLLKVLN